MKYQAFFFDFDGVLADSVEVKTKAFAKLFESYGPDVQAKVVDHHYKNGGMTRRNKFRYYYTEFLKKSLDDMEMERLCRTFSSLVVDEVVSSPEIPGADEFLREWYRKINCFVISATPDDEIGLIVRKRGLKIYFREVLGSSRSKDENLRILLERYCLEPENCLFFGDAESDYNAAKVHNMPFIGILPGSDAPLLQVASDIKWYKSFLDFIKAGAYDK